MQEIETRGVLSDEAMEALRQRNKDRAAHAIKSLGQRYLCHQGNRVKRLAHPMSQECRTLSRTYH